MNSQELRNLQEAYMEVVMEEMNRFDKKDLRNKKYVENSPWWGGDRYIDKRRVDAHDARRGVKQKKTQQKKTQQEQVDLYDIILSHLLDEGYAETQEAAEAIMVNMSEEWRESIVG